jgi:hypothetical protein
MKVRYRGGKWEEDYTSAGLKPSSVSGNTHPSESAANYRGSNSPKTGPQNNRFGLIAAGKEGIKAEDLHRLKDDQRNLPAVRQAAKDLLEGKGKPADLQLVRHAVKGDASQKFELGKIIVAPNGKRYQVTADSPSAGGLWGIPVDENGKRIPGERAAKLIRGIFRAQDAKSAPKDTSREPSAGTPQQQTPEPPGGRSVIPPRAASMPGQAVSGTFKRKMRDEDPALADQWGKDLNLPDGWRLMGVGRVREGSVGKADRYDAYIEGPNGEKRMIPKVKLKRGPRGGQAGLIPPKSARPGDDIPFEPNRGPSVDPRGGDTERRVDLDDAIVNAFREKKISRQQMEGWRRRNGGDRQDRDAVEREFNAAMRNANVPRTGVDLTGPPPIPGRPVGKIPAGLQKDHERFVFQQELPPGYEFKGMKAEGRALYAWIADANGKDVHKVRLISTGRDGDKRVVRFPVQPRGAGHTAFLNRRVDQIQRRRDRRRARGEAGPRTQMLAAREEQAAERAREKERVKANIRQAIAQKYPGAKQIEGKDPDNRVFHVVAANGEKRLVEVRNGVIVRDVENTQPNSAVAAPDDHILNPKPGDKTPLPSWLTGGILKAVTKRKSDSVNATFFADAPDGHGVLLKPEKGQYEQAVRAGVGAPSPGGGYKPPENGLGREMAAQVIARSLGVRMPRSVVRKAEFPSYQSYDGRSIDAGEDDALAVERIANVKVINEVGGYGGLHEASQKADIYRIAVMDVIIGNLDRHGGNALVDADGRVWAIDHGLAFPSQHKTYTGNTLVQDRSTGTPLPADIRAALSGMANNWAEITQELRAHGLTDAEITAARARFDYMRNLGRVPSSSEIKSNVRP